MKKKKKKKKKKGEKEEREEKEENLEEKEEATFAPPPREVQEDAQDDEEEEVQEDGVKKKKKRRGGKKKASSGSGLDGIATYGVSDEDWERKREIKAPRTSPRGVKKPLRPRLHRIEALCAGDEQRLQGPVATGAEKAPKGILGLSVLWIPAACLCLEADADA